MGKHAHSNVGRCALSLLYTAIWTATTSAWKSNSCARRCPRWSTAGSWSTSCPNTCWATATWPGCCPATSRTSVCAVSLTASTNVSSKSWCWHGASPTAPRPRKAWMSCARCVTLTCRRWARRPNAGCASCLLHR